ncbi:alkaline phosphatase D family protein [Coraliomargarita algicola]|uniref:Alkaline phosphatase D family protein n=1 Tax=Coraliomargarita algicola TaxID=3092156 RepID=A0ABZ0RF04_9BACT|nr:alkaline phosphatase D family protein [Coraliomargarita sp. J2-16]WPJ94592.1 alkaline phosphatase D family protein [Coraliomargarita sp. J2-16]
MNRRHFIKNSLIGVSASIALSPWSAFGQGPAILGSEKLRPQLKHGAASGDVDTTSAVLWSKTNQSAQMWVELSTLPDFSKVETLKGGHALQQTDYNAHTLVRRLLPNTRYFYRVHFQSLKDPKLRSEHCSGQFKTAPTEACDVRFCWSADTAGQGFGIDPAHGGMLTFASIRARKPDFFVNSGDLIYADNPMSSEVTLDDGSIWRNQLMEAKTRVAESTDDFRQNFYYNLQDDHLRALQAEVPMIQQWDDHEVVNNWYPQEILDDDRYTLKDVKQLAHNAKTAFFNCNPIRPHDTDPGRIYRKISRGPLLDLFVIDLRSYRGPNSYNHQTQQSEETAFLGADQLKWLKAELKASKATWKIICSDMPIGLVVAEWGKEIYENGANGDHGAPLGRELELADLFQNIAREDITNVHFITADVHYCASHYYNPAKASFKDFKPFWEFVSGPLHAGNFGPNPLDGTFGPEVKFTGIPEGMAPFTPPSEGLQFFGEMEIDGKTQALTVRHFNRIGEEIWSKELQPEHPDKA